MDYTRIFYGNTIFWARCFFVVKGDVSVCDGVLNRPGALSMLRIQYWVSLRYVCWTPNSQCTDGWRWNIWNLIMSWGWSPCDGINALLRTDEESLLTLFFLPHENTDRTQASINHEEALLRARLGWCANLGLLVSKLVKEKFFLLMVPSTCYIVLGIQTKHTSDQPKVSLDIAKWSLENSQVLLKTTNSLGFYVPSISGNWTRWPNGDVAILRKARISWLIWSCFVWQQLCSHMLLKKQP